MKFIVQDFQIAVLSLLKKLSITKFDPYIHQLCSKLKLTINYFIFNWLRRIHNEFSSYFDAFLVKYVCV
jgi:hypothetical protein